MKIKYKGQPKNSMICGPVVIFNALKWAGVSDSYKKAKPYLFAILKYKKRLGTATDTLIDFIKFSKKDKSLPFRLQRIKHKVTDFELAGILASEDKAVIMLIFGHVFLIIPHSGLSFKCINIFSGARTEYFMKRKSMKKLLKHKHTAFVIKKKL